MRLVGTAIICIVAAFGAAFLVARAADHEAPARAATPPVTTTPVAAVATPTTVSHKVNRELVSQFAPLKASLKPRPKPHRKHKAKPKPAVSVAPAASSPTVTSAPSTPVQPTPTYTQPYSPPPAPVHHKNSGGGSGGSGTTTIGG